jgi:nitrile hydratase subunit beta
MSYQSQADIGGEEAHGRVMPEPEGEMFHAAWERQMLKLTVLMTLTGTWNMDMWRSALETLPDYRTLSYFERWLRGLEKLLIEHGLVAADEISAGRMLYPARAAVRVFRAADVDSLFESDVPAQQPGTAPALFAVGDGVRTRAGEVNHHTRLPRYARGKRGHIERVHGAHVFPDTHALGLGAQPEWLYTVVFTGRELWGDSATEHLTVSIEAWEPYLELVL